MYRRFRCGRLMVTKDGTLKQLELKEGGGSRFCIWNNKNMDLNETHTKLRNLFNLRDRQQKTSLYNFERRRLSSEQYKTFAEYINRHGLNCNSTVLFLCTNDDNEEDETPTELKLEKNTSSTSTTRPASSTVAPSNNSSTTTNSTPSKASVNHQPKVYPSLLDYSFTNNIDYLMKSVRELITQNSFDPLLIQLFEFICVINGSIWSATDSLYRTIQQTHDYISSMSETEIVLYSNNLTKIDEICRSTATLLELNRSKFSHIKLYKTIDNSFAQFYDKLKDLHKQWLEGIEHNNTLTTATESLPTISNIQSLSSPQSPDAEHEYKELQPPITTTSNKLHIPSLMSLSCIESPSSSLQQPDANHDRKELQPTITTTPDTLQSPSLLLQTDDDLTDAKHSLFHYVLRYMRYFLTYLGPEQHPAFRNHIISSISQLEAKLSTIDLSNEASICDTKGVILTIKKPLEDKVTELREKKIMSVLDHRLLEGCSRTLTAIRNLSNALYNYQKQIQMSDVNSLNNSSLSTPSIHHHHNHLDQQSTQPNKRKTFDHDDEDQRYVNSRSSRGNQRSVNSRSSRGGQRSVNSRSSRGGQRSVNSRSSRGGQRPGNPRWSGEDRRRARRGRRGFGKMH